MVHITKAVRRGQTILYVGGQLTWDEIDDLAKHYAGAESPVMLELSQLVHLDSEGVEVLLELVSMGVELRGASPWIGQWMKQKEEAQRQDKYAMTDAVR